jgi:hypothetical protein
MMYLPPVFALALEALTCPGVAMTVWIRPRPALASWEKKQEELWKLPISSS